MERSVLLIWDDENYTLEDAIKDEAVTRVVVPSSLSPLSAQQYVNGVLAGLRVAGERISNYPQKLAYKEITEKQFTVPVEVLEWNTYDLEVWATDEQQAEQTALEQGVSLSHSDVTYGSSEYEEGESTDDRLVD